MQVEHELVIGRAVRDRQAHFAGHVRQRASQAVRWANFFLLHQLGQKIMERLAHIPHPPDGWINVGEHAQDARAMRGTRWECVHVQQIIAFMQ